MSARSCAWIAIALRIAVAVSCVIVLALPWLRQATGGAVFDAVDAVLGMQCHRLPGRVLEVGGVPLAVCSRCAGIYAGIGLGAALARPRWSARITVVVVGVAGAVLVLEAWLEWAGFLGVVHALRLLTGVSLSWPVSALAVRWARARLGQGRGAR